MTKLAHSSEAYLRYMQMSQAQVFLLVEGRDPDPYVYGKIATKALAQRFVYQVCRAEELERVGGGGKQALLRFFDLLQSWDSLGGDFKGKRWFALFFLDKDVDDLLGVARNSQHITYTVFYDIENHIYAAGRLRDAVAASASIDINEAPANLDDSLTWRRTAAAHWKEWVFLCLLVSRLGVSCACGYRLKSAINAVPNQPPSADPVPYLDAIRGLAQIGDEQFAAVVAATRADVDQYYLADEFDKVFKGKWYSTVLHADVIASLVGKVANRNALEVRLTPAIAQTLDPNGDWANAFLAPFGPLVQKFLTA